MPIDFSSERWEKIKENARLWWAGELERPLIQLTLWGKDPGRPVPKVPYITKAVGYDLSIYPEQIVDRWDYDLSCLKFMGDAFPQQWMDLGPGVAAAFMGSQAEPYTGTIWFRPEVQKEIADLHFQYDPDNIWLKRVKDISRVAMERWKGLVQLGMTDLGGNLDILSTFRPSENLRSPESESQRALAVG